MVLMRSITLGGELRGPKTDVHCIYLYISGTHHIIYNATLLSPHPIVSKPLRNNNRTRVIYLYRSVSYL